MRRQESLEKTLMLGKIQGNRKRGRQKTRWLDTIANVMGKNIQELKETVTDREAWRANIHQVTKSRNRLNNNSEKIKSVTIHLSMQYTGK